MNIRQALQDIQALGLDRLDAQMLVLLALERDPHDRAWLLSHDEDPVGPTAIEHLGRLKQRRLAGEPMAYLTGWQEFHGLRLAVDARVLVPRADTETLVEWALDVLSAREPSMPPPKIADLGTGSGAIALALAASRPDARVSAVDASSDALAVATGNAQRLGLPVEFRCGAWFDPLSAQRFDLVVSNPPYVAQGDPHLSRLAHEPRTALVSGSDGLDDLRRIVADAPGHLLPAGWLLLEHGHDQAQAVRRLLHEAGFSAVNSRTDLAGIERCSGGQWTAGG
ncbi:MAG: peptide chain release factor N(5)-glutamine methyltransferase [Burkholderiales bacterium]|nr:MAG: peptide chain release factor N(5)-glutamine methyltransferase [Burkholderiales bacterium]